MIKSSIFFSSIECQRVINRSDRFLQGDKRLLSSNAIYIHQSHIIEAVGSLATCHWHYKLFGHRQHGLNIKLSSQLRDICFLDCFYDIQRKIELARITGLLRRVDPAEIISMACAEQLISVNDSSHRQLLLRIRIFFFS